MKNLRVILGLLCAPGLSGCAPRRQAELARTHAALMDSMPAIVRSLPVRIVPSFEHPVLAWTTVGMMELHVSYNPGVAEKLPPEVLAFALVHESAHLQLNHVSAMGTRPAAEIRKQELEADRFAAKFWATHDPRVARAAAAAFLAPAEPRGLGSEQRDRDAGYPTWKERARVILDCLAETRNSSSLKDP